MLLRATANGSVVVLALKAIRRGLQTDLAVASRGVAATGLDARVADARDDSRQ
jgi:hypothetical protein